MHYLVPYSLHLSPGQLALGQQSNYLIHKLKVWWHYATLLTFIIFIDQSHSTIIHSFILHYSAEACFFVSSSLLRSARDEPPCGAEPGIELGPALQQADTLSTELRRTLTDLRRTLTELRRTLPERRRTHLFYSILFNIFFYFIKWNQARTCCISLTPTYPSPSMS